MTSYLFLDMNSFFASVEQQAQPELRGRPVGVVPVIAETTCCIAASYEAKQRGVKTGTGVAEAYRLCPDIQLTLARPKLYVEVHNKIVEAVETCLPVEKVCSIDEMVCCLMSNEAYPEIALAIGSNIKDTLRREVGPYVKCSIGIAPNRWAAKVATDLDKPDGLVVLEQHDLPQCFYDLDLEDLPGIGRGMKKRLTKAGIYCVKDLAALSRLELSAIWGSRVHGYGWWARLKGMDVPDPPTTRRTFGHSHVLAPEFRERDKAYQVLTRMIHKAAFRMRKGGYLARYLHVLIKYQRAPAWYCRLTLGYCRDTTTMIELLSDQWKHVPYHRPYHLSVTLTDLNKDTDDTMPLFHVPHRRARLTKTLDAIQDKYGYHTIHTANMLGSEGASPTRISFTQIPQMDEFTADDE